MYSLKELKTKIVNWTDKELKSLRGIRIGNLIHYDSYPAYQKYKRGDITILPQSALGTYSYVKKIFKKNQ